MSSSTIDQLQAKVRQLANKLHQAKRDLDWHQYNWAGLDNPEVRARSMSNWRTFPDSPIKREIERKAAAYRKARQELMATKAELDELVERQMSRSSVRSTRDRMQQKIAPELRGRESFDLSQHPKLIKEMTESIREAVQKMRNERSVPSVLAVVETLVAADQLGYDNVRGTQRKQAWKAAKDLAVELRDKMRAQVNPGIPEQVKPLVRLEALVQYLGG